MKKTGEPYSIDKDPLYDPDAPDWEQYDRPHYDDDDDEDDEDYENPWNDDRKNKDSDALAIGMGIGIVNGLTDDSVFGGESGEN